MEFNEIGTFKLTLNYPKLLRNHAMKYCWKWGTKLMKFHLACTKRVRNAQPILGNNCVVEDKLDIRRAKTLGKWQLPTYTRFSSFRLSCARYVVELARSECAKYKHQTWRNWSLHPSARTVDTRMPREKANVILLQVFISPGGDSPSLPNFFGYDAVFKGVQFCFARARAPPKTRGIFIFLPYL